MCKNRKQMSSKRYVPQWLIVMVSVMLLCGCGEKAQESDAKETASATTESAANITESAVSEIESTANESETEETEIGITEADLDKAHTEYPAEDGFADGGDSPYFLAAESDDKSAKLYCIYTDSESWGTSRGVLRCDEGIIPIPVDIAYGWGMEVYPGDFDGDGAKEYAITHIEGHGTGFYQEALIIADPGEKAPISRFSNADDILNADEHIYDKVKYEFDEKSDTLTYWLDVNGKRESEGTLEIGKDYWAMWDEGATFGELIYGDVFTITFENGKLVFEAKGGVTPKDCGYPDYTYSVNLCGDFVYKDGKISCENLTLRQ